MDTNRNHYDRNTKIMNTNICFECGGNENIHNHHIIPKSLGGTKTIPLCNMCHGKAHGKDNGIHKNPNEWKRLVKLGRDRWIENGGKLGRKVGTKESNERFMSKPINQQIKGLVENGMSVRGIANSIGVSTKTIVKVRKCIKGIVYQN